MAKNTKKGNNSFHTACNVVVQGHPLRFCDNEKEAWHLCCGYHWLHLPPAMQKRVYDLYKTEPGSADHQQMVNQCLSYLDALKEEQE